jgi:hypothetical protein
VTNRPLEIHIEELVLHGFPHLDSTVVGEALRQEIEQVFPSPGLHSVDHIDGGTFSLDRNDGSRAIGQRIAGVVARAVDSRAAKR